MKKSFFTFGRTFVSLFSLNFILSTGFIVLPGYAYASPGAACTQIAREMPTFCSQNPALIAAGQSTEGIQAILNSSPKLGRAVHVLGAQQAVQQQQAATLEAKRVCEEARNKCNSHCEAAKRQSAFGGYKIYENHKQQCNKEHAKAKAAFIKNLGQWAMLLTSIAALLKALGVGEDDAPDFDDIANPDDKGCSGPNAATLVRCASKSDPLRTRAGLNRPGANPGSLTGNPLFEGGPDEGSPGVDRGDGSGRTASGSPNGGSGPGGMGGLPGNGLAEGSSASDGSSEEGDGDGYGRYMDAGGGGGSGGGGGYSGGGGRGLANFGNFSSEGDKLASQNALDRKLKKYSGEGGTRSPASVGALNGPFQDNWEIVRKAYKSTSDSLLPR